MTNTRSHRLALDQGLQLNDPVVIDGEKYRWKGSAIFKQSFGGRSTFLTDEQIAHLVFDHVAGVWRSSQASSVPMGEEQGEADSGDQP